MTVIVLDVCLLLKTYRRVVIWTPDTDVFVTGGTTILWHDLDFPTLHRLGITVVVLDRIWRIALASRRYDHRGQCEV